MCCLVDLESICFERVKKEREGRREREEKGVEGRRKDRERERRRERDSLSFITRRRSTRACSQSGVYVHKHKGCATIFDYSINSIFSSRYIYR